MWFESEYISLEESGIHGAVATKDDEEHEQLEDGDGKGGIAPILKNETDAILMGGAGPMKCYLLLKKNHAGSEKMLSMLPSLLQLKNRKSYLKKRLGGHFEIVTLATLMEWVSKKICDGCCEFYGRPEGPVFDSSVLAMLDDLIVLRVFDHSYTENNTRVTSFGIIFTSRRIFMNVKRAMDGQGDSVFGASDGKFSKHFVPWSFMFVRTEHEAAHRELFAATREMSQSLFGIDLKLRFGSLDHSASIANAYRAVWPDIILLNCWPHLVRKSKEKVFVAMGHLIKKVAVESLRASTATVLNSTLPNILSLAAEDLDGSPTHVRHYTEGPIPAELFVRARVLISYRTNFLRMRVPGSKIIRAIVFNAEGYINSPTDAHSGVPVTAARVKRYTNSLKGDLVAKKTIADVPLLYMSLHAVNNMDQEHAALSNHPTWSHDER
ncbi:hypothetical protein P43SY_000860 [Pythium insidiosum]|uniref:MULE transposase domain-containing protein n=1 Tax=Pythium insidiosum TaxID=114742 RepID=A0AAD5L746_PYTIN|nr:hypothetical protein P43SY_000860 [Pythium insidiosum]